MRFEWDDQKSKKNSAKHGLSFDTACLVFDDPHAVSIQDRHEHGEERWQTIGLVGQAVILLVAHTCRDEGHGDEIIRIISARKATPAERRIYEQDDR
jgi:uncharacterized DUF497 family protein